jgi:hypothetical protein
VKKKKRNRHTTKAGQARATVRRGNIELLRRVCEVYRGVNQLRPTDRGRSTQGSYPIIYWTPQDTPVDPEAAKERADYSRSATARAEPTATSKIVHRGGDLVVLTFKNEPRVGQLRYNVTRTTLKRSTGPKVSKLEPPKPFMKIFVSDDGDNDSAKIRFVPDGGWKKVDVRTIVARVSPRSVSSVVLELTNPSYSSFDLDVDEYERLFELANAGDRGDSDSSCGEHPTPPPKTTTRGRKLTRSAKGAALDKGNSKKQKKQKTTSKLR